MNRSTFSQSFRTKRGLTAVLAAALVTGGSLTLAGCGEAASAARVDVTPGAATGLGQPSGLLPREKLTTESASQVNLSNDSSGSSSTRA